MKMKKYQKPSIKTVPLQFENPILAASGGGVSSGASLGREYNENDVTYSKPNSVWESDDED